VKATISRADGGMKPFQFESRQIRVVKDDQGEPWFVAKDVCDALELENIIKAVSGLDNSERMKLTLSAFQSPGRGGDNGKRVLISESGLYKLILRSDKLQALNFGHRATFNDRNISEAFLGKSVRMDISGLPGVCGKTPPKVTIRYV